MNLHNLCGNLAPRLALVWILISPATFAQASATPAATLAATPAAAASVQPAAQPTATAPESRTPIIQLSAQAPPPAPPVARTDKRHDGFYTRLCLGFGSQSVTIDPGESLPNSKASAGTLDIELLIGGAPSPGIVVGGALLIDSMPSTTFNTDSYSAKSSMALLTIGPFIDGYPNPRGGFHLGGTIGLSSARLANDPVFPTNKATGFGLAVWLGYDWWVADQWSVGGLLQLSGARTTGHENSADLAVDSREVALMFTAVYQ